jgi:hypothetical protein
MNLIDTVTAIQKKLGLDAHGKPRTETWRTVHPDVVGKEPGADAGVAAIPLMLGVSDATIMGVATLVFVGVILGLAIHRYKVDDFVKFWAAVGTVIGLALGGVGTFFFTKENVDARTAQAKTAETALQVTYKEAATKAAQLKKAENALLISESKRNEAVTKISQLSAEQPNYADKLRQITRVLNREDSIYQYVPKYYEWPKEDKKLPDDYGWYNTTPTPFPAPKSDSTTSPAPSSSAPVLSPAPVDPKRWATPKPSSTITDPNPSLDDGL